jgi:hypothetical protein
MVFVPEGQHDSSEARSALQFGYLERALGVIYASWVGLKSVAQGSAQGLSWVVLPTRISPEAEGATRHGDNRLGTFEPDRVRVSS